VDGPPRATRWHANETGGNWAENERPTWSVFQFIHNSFSILILGGTCTMAVFFERTKCLSQSHKADTRGQKRATKQQTIQSNPEETRAAVRRGCLEGKQEHQRKPKSIEAYRAHFAQRDDLGTIA